MKEMYYNIKDMVEADIQELVSKGSLEPCDYKPLGEAIDIVKDICKIEMMETDEGSWDGMSGNPNRSPRTGRYISRDGSHVPMDMSMGGRAWEIKESYHDPDGSIKADLEELLKGAKSDHERMLIMRVMGKMEH